MRVLDLFSGIGGFSLGLERAGMRTVAFCEIDPYCRAVLRKHWPDVPIFEDVRTLTGAEVGTVDVICGGYPCQPFSLTGKRLGQADDRHLWPEYRRLVEELRPAWVIGENVAGHINMGLDDVLSDLEALGYAARAFVIPACAVDAKHRRDRVWIVAYADRKHGERRGQSSGSVSPEMSTRDQSRWSGEIVAYAERVRELQPQGGERDKWGWLGDGGQTMVDTNGIQLQGQRSSWEQIVGSRHGQEESKSSGYGGWQPWPVEPDVGRVAYGIPNRAHRLRALGNAIVPQIPEIIGKAIMRAEGIAS